MTRDDTVGGEMEARLRRYSCAGPRLAFVGMGAALWVSMLLVNAPWAGFHGVLLGWAGILVAARPATVPLPRVAWLLAGIFWLAGCAAFLPATWFVQPAWRAGLENLGVATGELVTIQWRQALEQYAVLAPVPLVALWLAGHRADGGQARRWALAFACGVAAYAILSKWAQPFHPGQTVPGGEARFGFLPNRNHTACYLAMGTVCALGCVAQAVRDRRWPALAIASGAFGVCVWAVAAWSVSRAGVVLATAGCMLWLPSVRWRRMGRHGLWALGLLAAAVAGGFLLTNSVVKQRLTSTVAPASEKPVAATVMEREFRVPSALDTLDLIRDFKWTGVGAGQFRYVYPQYRTRSAATNNSDQVHPENDWLWLAAELGTPAAVALLALVVLAFGAAATGVARGRERALRGACLAAAALVPLHGFFDVPGHRVGLAWSAAWLFALALPPGHRAARRPGVRARLAALPVLAAAGWLLWVQFGPGEGACSQLPETVRNRTADLFAQEAAGRKGAAAKGVPYNPPADEDPLERALEMLGHAVRLAPMERTLRHYQAAAALSFDDRDDLVRRAFAIERALDPAWVGAPMEQARMWAPVSTGDVTASWNEAMARARHLDRVAPGTAWSAAHTWEAIRIQAAAAPSMEDCWKRWSDEHPKPSHSSQ